MDTQEPQTIDSGDVSIEDRDFVIKALEAAGVEVIGTGFGLGGADLWYSFNGKSYYLSLKASNNAHEKAA